MSIDDIKYGKAGANAEYQKQEAAKEEQESNALRLTPIGEMIFNKPKPAPMLLRMRDGTPFLPKGKVAMIAAEGGAGKTALLFNLAMSIATGRPFLNSCKEEEPSKVAFILGEEDMDDVHRRVWASSSSMELTEEEKRKFSENLFVLSCVGEGQTRFAEDDNRADELKKTLEDNGPWSLIIADPLSRFGGQEMETDNAQATATIQFFESLLKLDGKPTVLLSHHVRKSNNSSAEKPTNSINDIRGSSALKDGARWAATISAEKIIDRSEAQPMVLKILKANNVATGLEIKYEMKEGTVGALEEKKPPKQSTVLSAKAQRLMNQ